MEQVEAQKEMILGLEDHNKHLEEEQDRLREGLQEAMSQIGWLRARVVVPREVIDLTDSSDEDDEDGPDEGQDRMDEGSPPESGDSSDSYQQPPISGSGGLYMRYMGGSNRLVPIEDALDGEAMTEVAQLIESGVAPSYEERIFDARLPPPFVRCVNCGV